MHRTVEIRPASPEDIATVARIWWQGWQDGHLGLVPDELVALRTEETFHERAAHRLTDTSVVVVDGEVAGFVVVIGDEVEQVYVAGSHRGTGVADALIAEAERRVGAAGHRQAWLAVATGNHRARAFYERTGWIDEGPFAYPAEAGDATIAVPCHRYSRTLP